MTWQIVVAVLALTLSISSGCVPEDQLYNPAPQNITVEEGKNATFTCVVNDTVPSNVYNYFWQYQLVGESVQTFDINNNPYGLSLSPDDKMMIVPAIIALNGARFICDLTDQLLGISVKDSLCNDPTVIPIAFAYLFVRAPPTIFVQPLNPVNTLETATIQVTVQGYPRPEISLFYIPQNGGQVLLSDDSNTRVSIAAGDGANEYTITIADVRRADAGNYKIVAQNGLEPNAEDTFSLTVTGLDPPVVEVSPSEVVAPYNDRIQVFCSIQADAYNRQTTVIQWSFNNVLILANGDNNVYATDHDNGTVSLSIKALLNNSVGTYTCRANNSRTDSKAVSIFGPPPSPLKTDIDFSVTAGSISISWKRPDHSAIITQYRVALYSNSAFVLDKLTATYPGNHTTGSITIEDLSAGDYQFTITSLARDIPGPEGTRVAFTVEKPFPVAVVASAAAGGLAAIVIVLVVVIVGILICCSCYASRKKINSQHQRWGSEEEKMAGQTHAPAVQNSYTALALNDSSELPPSPMSPMTSAMGIDPKWEFPKENIVLFDELAVGQFTVLYKGMAKGLRDNRSCDVAVKSLRDGATEDDLKALIYEMDMLATIEEHPNIVSLLRVCTVGKPVFMVMEYMCHGDMLGFLRSCRGYRGMYAVSPGPRYQPPAVQLTSRDLLNMATKIANGMRFLADRKIVHRALCAKNILVGAGMDVKIYNVGSFDIPIDTGDGLAKWMAPETLFDGTNTTYSDVWSFGVTMWELITIGGTPYADVPAEELYGQLQSGMRMPCPPHCAQEVYDIIDACWQKNPQERPHFAIIHENLDELVMSKLSYLDLRNYDTQAYSDFVNSVTTKSTPL